MQGISLQHLPRCHSIDKSAAAEGCQRPHLLAVRWGSRDPFFAVVIGEEAFANSSGLWLGVCVCVCVLIFTY